MSDERMVQKLLATAKLRAITHVSLPVFVLYNFQLYVQLLIFNWESALFQKLNYYFILHNELCQNLIQILAKPKCSLSWEFYIHDLFLLFLKMEEIFHLILHAAYHAALALDPTQVQDLFGSKIVNYKNFTQLFFKTTPLTKDIDSNKIS